MSPISEPPQEQMMAAVAGLHSDLSGLRPGGWEYPRTPGVERTLPPPGSQMPSELLPRLFVVPGSGARLEPAGVGATSRAYAHAMHVDIHGVVEADEDTLADTWRWRLRQDVLATLHGHLSLSGTARVIDFNERAEAVDQGELLPKVWFVQPITVGLYPQTYETAA